MYRSLGEVRPFKLRGRLRVGPNLKRSSLADGLRLSSWGLITLLRTGSGGTWLVRMVTLYTDCGSQRWRSTAGGSVE